MHSRVFQVNEWQTWRKSCLIFLAAHISLDSNTGIEWPSRSQKMQRTSPIVHWYTLRPNDSQWKGIAIREGYQDGESQIQTKLTWATRANSLAAITDHNIVISQHEPLYPCGITRGTSSEKFSRELSRSQSKTKKKDGSATHGRIRKILTDW